MRYFFYFRSRYGHLFLTRILFNEIISSAGTERVNTNSIIILIDSIMIESIRMEIIIIVITIIIITTMAMVKIKVN